MSRSSTAAAHGLLAQRLASCTGPGAAKGTHEGCVGIARMATMPSDAAVPEHPALI